MPLEKIYEVHWHLRDAQAWDFLAFHLEWKLLHLIPLIFPLISTKEACKKKMQHIGIPDFFTIDYTFIAFLYQFLMMFLHPVWTHTSNKEHKGLLLPCSIWSDVWILFNDLSSAALSVEQSKKIFLGRNSQALSGDIQNGRPTSEGRGGSAQMGQSKATFIVTMTS